MLLLAASASAASSARADVFDTTWLGGAGAWSDATKWSGGVVPKNSGSTTFRAFIPGGDVSSMNPTPPISIDALSIGAGASCTSSTALTVGGACTINGSLSIQTKLTLMSPTLDGSGTLLVGPGLSVYAQLAGTSGLDIGAGLSVRLGRDSAIVTQSGPCTNRGLISGGFADTWRCPYVFGDQFTNLGTLEATQGFLVLGSGATYTRADLGNLTWGPNGTFLIGGTLLNAGQVLHADPTHAWGVLGGTISGGMVQTDPGTSFIAGDDFHTATFEGVTVNGTVFATGTLQIRNGISGNADIALPGGWDGPARIVSLDLVLTIPPSVTIRAAPQLFRPDDSLGHEGYFGDGSGPITNHGTLRTARAVGNPGGPPHNIRVFGTSMTNDGTMSIDRGTVFYAGVRSSGSMDLTFEPGGVLQTSLNSATLAGAGLLDVSGRLDLSAAGDRLVLLSGTATQFNSFYRIITTGGGVIGQFDSVTPGFEVMYAGNDVFARQVPEPAGMIFALMTACWLQRGRGRRRMG